MNNILRMLADRAKLLWNLESAKPLQIAIMGQTGVGKSSLINALFGTDFETSPVRPGTMQTQERTKEVHGNKLKIYDLPGIGESQMSDQNYLGEYRLKLSNADIAIWAIHADSRSFTFDRNALDNLLQSIENREEKTRIINKIIFVLTKADLLALSPWVLTKNGKNGIFTAHGETEKLLGQRAEYFQEVFIRPYKDYLRAQTYISRDFNFKNEHLDHDKFTIYYKGFLEKEELARLKVTHPEFEDTFNRLYDNYRVIPCSSKFRYNLDLLMHVIVDKLESYAIGRLEKFKASGTMNRVSFYEAKHFRNIVVHDEATNRWYDLSAIEYSPME